MNITRLKIAADLLKIAAEIKMAADNNIFTFGYFCSTKDQQWCETLLNAIKNITIEGYTFKDESVKYTYNYREKNGFCAVYWKYNGNLARSDMAASHLSLAFNVNNKEINFSISIFPWNTNHPLHKIIKCSTFEEAKTTLQSKAKELSKIFTNNLMAETDEFNKYITVENVENAVNGGWGAWFRPWSGGMILVNMSRLKGGLAHEFWVDCQLEYDQEWPNGWNESRVLNEIGKLAQRTKYSQGGRILFIAKDYMSIKKIRMIAKESGMGINKIN